MGGFLILLVATRAEDGHAGDEGEHDESGGRLCWQRGQFVGGGLGGLPILYCGRGLGGLPILYRGERPGRVANPLLLRLTLV